MTTNETTDYAALELSAATVSAIKAHAALVTLLSNTYGDAGAQAVADAGAEMRNSSDRDEPVWEAGWWLGLAHRLRRIAGERGLSTGEAQPDVESGFHMRAAKAQGDYYKAVDRLASNNRDRVGHTRRAITDAESEADRAYPSDSSIPRSAVDRAAYWTRRREILVSVAASRGLSTVGVEPC